MTQIKTPSLSKAHPSPVQPSFLLINTSRVPSHPHGWFGFIGRISLVFEIQHHVINLADFVNKENHVVKIIFSSINRSQMTSIHE